MVDVWIAAFATMTGGRRSVRLGFVHLSGYIYFLVRRMAVPEMPTTIILLLIVV